MAEATKPAAGLTERHPPAAATGRAPTARSGTRRRGGAAPRPGGRRPGRCTTRPAGRRRSRCRRRSRDGLEGPPAERASSRHAATRRGSVPPTGSQRSDQRTRSDGRSESSTYMMLSTVVDDACATGASRTAHSRGRGGRASPWKVRRRGVHRSPPGHLSSPRVSDGQAHPRHRRRRLHRHDARRAGSSTRTRSIARRQPPPRRAVGHGARGRTRTSTSSRATCSTWRG